MNDTVQRFAVERLTQTIRKSMLLEENNPMMMQSEGHNNDDIIEKLAHHPPTKSLFKVLEGLKNGPSSKLQH
jgi:hypothetical protein